jgi:hypothetical protein
MAWRNKNGGAEPDAATMEKLYAEVAAMSSPTPDLAKAASLKLISDKVDSVMKQGDSSRQLLPTVNAITDKLEKGLVTGKLEGFVTDVKALASRFGIEVNQQELGNSQSARAMLGQFMLEYLQKTKGAISERENTLFQSMGPEFSKSPQANKELVGLVRDRIAHDLRLSEIASDRVLENDLYGAGAEINKANKEFEDKYNKSIDSLYEKYAPKAAPAPAGRSGLTPNGRRSDEDLLNQYR